MTEQPSDLFCEKCLPRRPNTTQNRSDATKTLATCKACVDKDGKPDSKCKIRDSCPDDASTIEPRVRVYGVWSTTEAANK